MEKEKKRIEIRRWGKKLWRFEWQPKPGNLRKRAVKILAGYLAVMVVLTITSRALRGITMPEVTVSTAFSSTIDQVTEVAGRVEYNSQKPVYLEAGLKVDSILVQEGQKVEEGEALVSFHMEDLQQQISVKKEEVKAAKAQYQALIQNQSVKDRQEQQKAQRAQEDYELACERADFEVARAQEARDQAWERYLAALSEGAESTEALRTTYEQAQRDYENALWSRESALLEAARELEDANLQSADGGEAEAAKLEWNQQKEALQKLKNIKKAGGVAAAPFSGIVSERYLGEGEITQESAAFLIAQPQGGISFAADLNAEEQAQLDGEGEISVILGAREEEFTNLQIRSRASSEENSQEIQVKISLPSEAADFGLYGTLKIVSSSQMYDVVVPLKALHQGDSADSYYVFLMREEEGILGAQWKVQPLEVRIAQKNQYYAALTTKELMYGQQIVVDTDKPLEAGDVVRLAEE